MRMRETNHLRKYANEAGRQMRSKRKQFAPASGFAFCGCTHARLLSMERICSTCGKPVPPLKKEATL